MLRVSSVGPAAPCQFAAMSVSGVFMQGISRCPWMTPTALFLALPRWAATQEVLQHRQLVRGGFRLQTVVLVGSGRGGEDFDSVRQVGMYFKLHVI